VTLKLAVSRSRPSVPYGANLFQVGAEYCSQRVCLFVCQRAYVKTRISNFTKFSTRVTCGRSLVIVWRQCDTLCTSGFVDDGMFS